MSTIEPMTEVVPTQRRDEHTRRAVKAARLVRELERQGRGLGADVDSVHGVGVLRLLAGCLRAEQWEQLSVRARCNPPSERTIRLVLDLLADKQEWMLGGFR